MSSIKTHSSDFMSIGENIRDTETLQCCSDILLNMFRYETNTVM